ncbi:MAG: fasciclin domain-containing protein, partial [Bacteroidales bacterium]|nr:fasciclin domain-containing protein [Bacteroidales bacterium]
MKYVSVNSLGLMLLSMFMLSCADQWAEHIRPVDKNLETTLFQAIKAEQELSLFGTFLQETAYDVVLESMENYTVFAPVNAALSAYESASVEVKRNLVKNHIAA